MVAFQVAWGIVAGVQFEWDENKAAKNFAKHGIRFDDAVDVFDDPDKFEFEDTKRDYGEIRMNTVGRIGETLILTITHTDRLGVTRLISARPASRKERREYYGKNNQNDA